MPFSLKPWFLAIRPKTLPASIAPVFLGTAMAFGDGVWHGPSALIALFGAVMIQIGTNLANDYFDFKKGVDTAERRGPLRATQSGLIPAEMVKWGFIASFTLAALAAVPLIMRAGWPIVVIGVLSILSGIFYAAGPKPLSHLGLGDIFVLIFFGPVAVAGTYYVQSFEMNSAVILMGFACGFLSTAVLCVNNLRDIVTDRQAGKLTLAVRFGKTFARGEYLFCLLAACALPPLVHLLTEQHPWTVAASFIIFLCIPPISVVYTDDNPDHLNDVLAQTGQALFLFTFLYSIAWIR
jgi:1,4-dihydroxy-2-naphthoate octaprenyltransferase